MNKLKCLLIVVAVTWCCGAIAENMRGRVDRPGTYGPVPVVGQPVLAISMEYDFIREAVTGRDGMYFIYNVPPGYYKIEFMDPAGYDSLMNEVYVVPGRYMTDVPPFLVPW